MGKNHIVINSLFQPFSYDLLVRPLLESTLAHMQLETDMSELSAKASEIGNLANQEKDPEVYAQYKKYEADLLSQAEGLAKQGLNPTSRKNMLGMRTRFAEDIVPIQRAHSRLQELDKEQRLAELANPTMVWSKKASAMTLKEAIDNPMLGYESAQGNLAAKQVAELVKGYADLILDPSKRNELRTILGGQRFEEVRQYGFTREALLEVMSGAGDESLNAIIDNAVAATGVTNWGGESEINQIRNHAKQGVWAAMGKTDIVGYDNKEYETAAQRRAAAPKTTENKGLDNDFIRQYVQNSRIVSNSKIKDIDALIETTVSGNESMNMLEARIAANNYPTDYQQLVKTHGAINRDAGNWTGLTGNTISKAKDEAMLKSMKEKHNAKLKELGIDLNNSKSSVEEQLRVKQNEAIQKYSSFNMNAVKGGYDNIVNSIVTNVAFNNLSTESESAMGIKDAKTGDNTSVEVFRKAVKEGVSGMVFNRDPDNPSFTIIADDENQSSFKVDAWLVNNADKLIKDHAYTYYEDPIVGLNPDIKRLKNGTMTQEEFDIRQKHRNADGDFDTQQYNLLGQITLQGANQKQTDTNTANLHLR